MDKYSQFKYSQFFIEMKVLPFPIFFLLFKIPIQPLLQHLRSLILNITIK